MSLTSSTPQRVELTTALVILVADEHEATRRFLADQLAADGYEVSLAADHDSAVSALTTGRPIAAMIVDLTAQTLGLLDAIRRCDHRLDAGLPVIVLTGTRDPVHRVRLLERGSDDVITKPFSYPEVRARLANLLSRTAERPQGRSLMQIGPVMIDTRRRAVTVDGTEVRLTKKQYDLLLAFAAEPTRVFPREELMRSVWGFVGQGTRSLDSTCARLRATLGITGERFIENIWGVGYRFVQPAELASWQRPV